jgi:beta-lactamase regulating signal transducer with metallopeptidase domain
MTPPLLDFAHLESLSTGWANTMIAVSWKAMVLLAIAGLTTFLLRRRAAATRHLVWNASVLAVLCLPALALMVPALQVDTLAGWHVDPRSEPTSTSTSTHTYQLRSTSTDVAPTGTYRLVSLDNAPVIAGSVSPRPFEIREIPANRAGWGASLRTLARDARAWSTKSWALLGWELGALLVLSWFALGNWRVWRLRRGCIENRDPMVQAELEEATAAVGLSRPPRLLWTNHAYTPLTLGVWRAELILPDRAREWSAHQRREVLLHELAHVQRRDVFTQGLAQLACALFWFHPLPWIAAGRMRLERERACDDRVLMAGSRASTYASHLLEMARSLHFESALSTASVAMARRSQLGERMESLLDRRPRGRSMGRAARAFVIAATLALALPLAAMRPAADAPTPPTPSTPTPATPPEKEVELEREAPDSWTGNYFSYDDQHALLVSSHGDVHFTPSRDGIESMGKDATFELETRGPDGTTRRRVEFVGKADEGFETHYFVDSQSADFDDAAREWFSQALQDFLERRANGHGVRVARALAPNAASGVAIGSAPAVAPRALVRPNRPGRSWTIRTPLRGRLDRIDDAIARRPLVRALTALGDSTAISTEELSSALKSADGLANDFEKAQVLAALIPHVAGDPDREEMFYRVADELQSDAQYESLALRLRAAAHP